jgi:hypothetical protein
MNNEIKTSNEHEFTVTLPAHLLFDYLCAPTVDGAQEIAKRVTETWEREVRDVVAGEDIADERLARLKDGCAVPMPTCSHRDQKGVCDDCLPEAKNRQAWLALVSFRGMILREAVNVLRETGDTRLAQDLEERLEYP